MAELIKPCPFCGSKAELICFNIEYGTVTVGCTNQDCDITMGKGFFSDEEAIEHWNRRVNESEIRAKAKAKAIDEFAEKLNQKITEFVLEHQSQLTFVSGVSMGWKFVDEIAEQLKGEQ